MSIDEIQATVRGLKKNTSDDHRLASTVVKWGMVLLGAGLAGAAQFMDTPKEGVAWNRVLGFLGVALAFLGGIWSNIADRHASTALQKADEAIELASATQAGAERLRLETRTAFEVIRRQHAQLRQLLGLSNILREGVERALVRPAPALDEELKNLLLGAYRSILASMRCEAGERWTLTIYREEGSVLKGAAACTVDRGDQAASVREWPVGQGYAGAAFARDEEIVLEDAQAPTVLAVLNVPKSLLKPDDHAKYRSVAAVPIRVAGLGRPWGVVIATSDQLGRFDSKESTEGALSAQVVRLLAGMIALMVAGEGGSRTVAGTDTSN